MVGGAVNLNGVELDFNPFSSSMISSTRGQSITLLNKTSAGAVSGTFVDDRRQTIVEGETQQVGGRTYEFSYAGGDGNDVTITDVTAPPSGSTPAMQPSSRYR